MGRRPCCAKEGLNRGAWSAREDKILINYIKVHGEGKWRKLPQKAGLLRCGKSCRLRWLNYLRPDIKRGSISLEEEDLIIRLHKLLGNRWSLIAGRLPGRTDNEIKNYWKTNLSKRVGGNKDQISESKKMECVASRNHSVKLNSTGATAAPQRAIRTKAVRCTKAVIPRLVEPDTQKLHIVSEAPPSSAAQHQDNSAPVDFDISDCLISDASSLGSRRSNDPIEVEDDYYGLKNLPFYPVPDSAYEPKFCDLTDGTVPDNQWTCGDPFKDILDLAFF